MNKRKIAIIILMILLCLLLGLLSYILFFNNDSNKNETNTNKEFDKSINRVRNNSDKIKEEHCLNNFCIDDMQISSEYENIQVITGTVTNKSSETIPEGLIGLVFNVDGKVITQEFYYLQVEPGASFPLQTNYDNSKIINAGDYKIIQLSNEELLKYKEKHVIES